MHEQIMERHLLGQGFSMRDFRSLQVWQKAHEMTLAVYEATAHFPRDEIYGLVSQIRRAAASIPTNIAEGCGRDGAGELGRFMQIAMGSASELEYGLLLAHELGFLGEEEHQGLHEQCTAIKRMLTSFLHRLKADS